MKGKNIFGSFDINKDFSFIINPAYFYNNDDTHFGLLIKIKTQRVVVISKEEIIMIINRKLSKEELNLFFELKESL